MIQYKFDRSKAIASILYVVNILNRVDFHKLSKILYFAERKHLSRYGRPITWDWYVAMKNGPVPSNIYDILKIVKGESVYKDESLKKYFAVEENYFVTAKQQTDLDEFSETDLECLDESIAENKNLSFTQLTDKSHDTAWKNAPLDDHIDFIDIAKAEGADINMIEYIQTVVENRNLIFNDRPEPV